MKVKAVPEGFHTITPYFTVRGAPQLIEFLKQAFGAEELHRSVTPNGTVMNAVLRVGDSMVMMGEAPPDTQKFLTAMLYMYVDDADAVYRRAMKAGGKSISEPADQIYGDRTGAVEDIAGNQWWIATRKEDVPEEELARRAAQHAKK